MSAINIVILIFAVLGAVDYILGNKFGLGKEFARGFELFAPMALTMIGMIVIAPAIGIWLEPMFEGFYGLFHIDPSVIPASLLANDMGGASLSNEIAKSEVIGGFNAYVVSSMMGCVISFTIPFASGVVDRSQHKEMFLGFLCGIVTIPFGCILSGFVLGLGFAEIIVDLLPIIILAVIVALGLVFVPDLSVKIFKVFGYIMKVIIIIGLMLGIFTFLTGKTVFSGFESFEEGARVCVNASVTLAGAFPFMFILSKILRRPMSFVGSRLGVNVTSAVGFIPTLISSTPTFGLMRDMDKKGVVLNSAFAVSAAFTFGGHLAFTMSFDGRYVLPMIIAKVVSGIFAVLLALLVYRGNRIKE